MCSAVEQLVGLPLGNQVGSDQMVGDRLGILESVDTLDGFEFGETLRELVGFCQTAAIQQLKKFVAR